MLLCFVAFMCARTERVVIMVLFQNASVRSLSQFRLCKLWKPTLHSLAYIQVSAALYLLSSRPNIKLLNNGNTHFVGIPRC